jgi:ABC-type dipeptide/oligopeptide/nickel transport system permease subunit
MRFLKSFLSNPSTMAASIVIALVVLLAIAAPLVSPWNPVQVFSGLRNAPLLTPGHILGTDQAGRDILSRLIWGARITLVMGTVPVVLSMMVGTLLGLVAAYYGGVLDFIISRLMEVLFAFPLVLLAVLAAAVMGKGMVNAMLAMAIAMIPYVIRAVYAAAKPAMGLTYVEASIIRGASAAHVMLAEILPSIFPSLIVFATSMIPLFIIFAAGLSYLGVAIQPPTPEWGLMIAEGQQVIQVAPNVPTVPGLVLLTVCFCMNVISDRLQRELDPRSRRHRGTPAPVSG